MSGVAAIVAAARRDGAAGALDGVSERHAAADTGEEALNAFLAFDVEPAREAAAEVDRRLEAGEDLQLAGVPVAIKDNICTTEFDTTCGSRILEGYRSPYDATVIRKLRAAGALIVGKTNMDEFAMGSSTEHSAYGVTRNPLDRERVPGGSSGGSAAAVAAGIVPAALGSETGGSVRQPAAFCGVVGTKPTYGRVSRYGLVAFASSLDQVGTFGRTVQDAGRLLQVVAGPDRFDSTCEDRPAIEWDAERGLDGMVVGLPEEFFAGDLDAGVSAACEAAIEAMREAGAELRPVSLPSSMHGINTYYVIAPAEASSNLARFDGVRYGPRAEADGTERLYVATRSMGFGAEVKRRIMLGTYALSAGHYDAYYTRAQAARARIAEEFDRVFADGVDVLFTPTTPTPAFRIGEKEDPYQMYLADVFTVGANLAGVPAISLPIGRSDGLPVGGQFIAPRWGEGVMLEAAGALERLLGGVS